MSILDLGIKFTEEILRSGYSTQFNNPNDKIIDENSSVIINKLNELILRKNIPKISLRPGVAPQLPRGYCGLSKNRILKREINATGKLRGYLRLFCDS